MQHILFQDIEVRLNFRAEIGSKRLANLMRISRSKLAAHVKSLVIKLDDTYEYSTPVESGHGDAGRRTLVFFQDLAQSLPLCVQALRNLRSLDVGCRSASYSSGSEELLPHEHCQQLDTTMAVILTYADLDHLENLTISVPCTYDIHTIMEYDRDRAYSQCRPPLARTMSSLRSLTLNICDSSDPQGQRYFYKQTSMLLQTFGSQAQYAQSFFDFAGVPPNLESLAISCTAPLNFDLFDTSRLQRLRNLSLTCVKISGDHLLRLLTQNRATLDTIWFTQVELNSRTWEDVLVQLCGFPLLIQVAIQSSDYASDGLSSRFSICLLPEIDNPQSIEGFHSRDNYALGDLTRLVNRRRRERSLLEITDTEERSILLESLADLGLMFTEVDE